MDYIWAVNFKATSTFRPVDLVKIRQILVPKILAAVREGAEAVVEEAQAIVPVDTGDLHASIHVASLELVGTSVSATVTADSPHAAFVEYGTGIRGEGTYMGDLPADWQYDYKNQNWPGHAAQPFMRPALDIGRAAILSAFRKQGFKV